MGTIAIDASNAYGLGVNSTGTLMAVVCWSRNKLFLYQLPSGRLLREVGDGAHAGPGKFNQPYQCCFTAEDNVLVAEFSNCRVQELTSAGDHRRMIPTTGHNPCAVCCNGTIIAVGMSAGKVHLFDYGTGAFRSQVGAGVLEKIIDTVKFSADGALLFARDRGATAVAISVADGTTVRHLTACEAIKPPQWDLQVVPSGELFVTDSTAGRISVFSADGATLLRSFGAKGEGDGQFKKPVAIAYANRRLYVLDNNCKRVQVFE